MAVVLAACGGFLVAVLWMDLMFDVQVLGADDESGVVAEPALASIAAYYRRVTTDAWPMGRVVGLAMLVLLTAAVVQLLRGAGPFPLRLLALLLAVMPIGLAAVRVVPNAVRLGARADAADRQSALARSIFRDHVLCLASVLAFLAVELVLALG